MICLYFSSLHDNVPDNLYAYGIRHVDLYHTSAEFYNSLCDWGGGGGERMNENKPPFQHVVHSSVLSAKTLKWDDTKESHPEHYRTHSSREFNLSSTTNTRQSKFNEAIFRDTSNQENKTGLQIPLR